ncbi:TetR/AcrR family transcriptional regulator [Streptomyces sp. NPDC097727]|uniref:TetR/AcrR family transcriptional regulator n=1 Tax=Streptomyces sp. NPDC097727 TaxID=3366092 RepID=UPI0037F9FAEE
MRNHARIIECARETFAHTPDATLKSVARGAGVGQGTMYRHFPTSDHLLLAVYEDEIEGLADAAAPLLELHEPPQALRLWLERLAAQGGPGTAARRAVAAATRSDISTPAYARISSALEVLLGALRAEHRLRPGVTAHEVLLLMSYAWTGSPYDMSAPIRHDVLDIVLIGLGVGRLTCADAHT